MPNARKKGKRKFQFWLAPSHAALLKGIAEEMGLNMSDAIRELLLGYVSEHREMPKNKKEKKEDNE